MALDASPSSTPVSAPQPKVRIGREALAGFLVFLIALPLCLGISLASGFPPLAGVVTAVVGGLLVSPIMGAPLTIKGPAAGLIVIALGAVTELGGNDPAVGYRRALACIVVAGVLQVGLGAIRAGRVADFFPSSVVHGMLAAIGLIIMAKQFHILLGVKPAAKEPLELLAEVPHSVAHLNPEVAFIGLVSLVAIFLWSRLKNPIAKKIPAPLVVLVIAMPLGFLFDLEHEHTYTFSPFHATYSVGPTALITLPAHLTSALGFPDFSAVTSFVSLRYIFAFTVVGSLESLLSARAIDQIDPNKGISNYDRDLLAVGLGNTVAGLLGGLPMIAEIVRSKANVDAGAKTRWSNFSHGAFLLIFVGFFPWLVHRIPLAALAGMLVFTGSRLASLGEFKHAYKVGKEQLVVFVVTMIGCVAVDLLVGVAAGIVCQVVLDLALGAVPRTLFRPRVAKEEREGAHVLRVEDSATFTNYIALKNRVIALSTSGTVVLDFSQARYVDHTTMERLHDLEHELAVSGKKLLVVGTEKLARLSEHPMAARRGALTTNA